MQFFFAAVEKNHFHAVFFAAVEKNHFHAIFFAAVEKNHFHAIFFTAVEKSDFFHGCEENCVEGLGSRLLPLLCE